MTFTTLILILVGIAATGAAGFYFARHQQTRSLTRLEMELQQEREVNLSELDDRNKTYQAEMNKAEKRIREAQDALKQEQQQRFKMEKLVAETASRYEELQKHHQTLQTEAGQLQEDKISLRERLRAAEALHNEQKNKIKELTSKLDASDMSLDQLRVKYNGQTEQLARLEERFKSMQEAALQSSINGEAPPAVTMQPTVSIKPAWQETAAEKPGPDKGLSEKERMMAEFRELAEKLSKG